MSFPWIVALFWINEHIMTKNMDLMNGTRHSYSEKWIPREISKAPIPRILKDIMDKVA